MLEYVTHFTKTKCKAVIEITKTTFATIKNANRQIQLVSYFIIIFGSTFAKKYMQQSTIKIDVLLDAEKIPESIQWSATDSSAEMKQHAKAMAIAFWDAADKSAMRIDLWTKDMMVDEMGEFYYQMLHSMSDSFLRATRNQEQANELKLFADSFIKKVRANQLKENSI
jgi:gliding motility-associated protein GldC